VSGRRDQPSPEALAEAQRILDAIARRLLAEKLAEHEEKAP
jgi:hypothetical protein